MGFMHANCLEPELHFASGGNKNPSYRHPTSDERLMSVELGNNDRLPEPNPWGTDVLRAVIELLPAGIVLTDDHDRCVAVNPAALNLLGYAKPELLARTLSEISEIGSIAVAGKPSRGSPATEHPGTRISGMVVFRMRNGVATSLETTSYSHIQPGLHLLVLTDPRARVRTEEDRSVTDGQWLNAQRLETLGRLASGIAHDFNNVLTAINGHVQLAAEMVGENDDAQEHLRLAHQAGQNARDLVRRILLFARDLPEPKRGTFDLAALVRETSGLVSASLPSTLSLELDLPEEPALVSADAGQVQHVLMSLCSLAAQAMDGRAGTLKVSVYPMRQERQNEPVQAGVVSLVVSDTGRPMTAVFEEEETARNAGIPMPGNVRAQGLSVARRIIARYGGQLRVQGLSGQGNRYEVHLPGVRVAPAEPVVPVMESPAPQSTGARVLVIDDEPSVCRYIELALKRARYQPEAFTSASEGWARFVRSPSDFHLLVVDLAMPEMVGLEIVQQSRALRPGLPVLLMSGDLQQFDLSAIAAYPEVTLLRKPIELHELWNRVGRAIREAGTPAS